MSPLPIGAAVKIGQNIGKTSNTGKMGRRIRRDALHFAILYSRQPEWSNDGRYVAPREGYWMDPNAFYRLSQPYDSQSLVDLPDDQKKTPVPHLKVDGSFMPSATNEFGHIGVNEFGPSLFDLNPVLGQLFLDHRPL